MSQHELMSYVTEYQIMYTTNVHQKLKSWCDGRLKFYKFNNKVQIFSEDNVIVGQEFLKNEKMLHEDTWGEEVIMGGLLITIDSITSESVRDISKVFTKSSEANKSVQTPSTIKTTTVHRSAACSAFPLMVPTIKRRRIGLSKLATPSKHQARLNPPPAHKQSRDSVFSLRDTVRIPIQEPTQTASHKIVSTPARKGLQVPERVSTLKSQSTKKGPQADVPKVQNILQINHDIQSHIGEDTTAMAVLPRPEVLAQATVGTCGRSEGITSQEPTQLSPSLNRAISTLKRIAVPVEKRNSISRNVIRPIRVKLEKNNERCTGEGEEDTELYETSFVTWDFGSKDDQLLRDLQKRPIPALTGVIKDPEGRSAIASSSRQHESFISNNQTRLQQHNNIFTSTTIPSRSRGLRIARAQREVIGVAAPVNGAQTPAQAPSGNSLLIHRTINRGQRSLPLINTPQETPKRKALQSLNINSGKKLALKTPIVNKKSSMMTPVSNLPKKKITVYTGDDSDDSIEGSQLVAPELPSKDKLTQTETYNYGGNRGYRISELDDLL